MNKQTAQNIIDKTRDDYNLIADQFASTRKYNWPEVVETLGDILKKFDKKQKIKVLDIGCGAGRVSEMFGDYNVDYYGIDLSKGLIDVAKSKYPKAHFTVGDGRVLPYRDNEFDIVLTIATIHHLPSRETRRQFFSEMYRVCKPSGTAFVETWYFWNKKEFLSRILKSFFSLNGLPFGDFYRPWKNSKAEQLTDRYFHAYTIRELKKHLKITGFHDIKVYDFHQKSRNLNIICQK